MNLIRMITNRSLLSLRDLEQETGATRRQVSYRLEN